MSSSAKSAYSFRDPAGRTLVERDFVTREVTQIGWPDLECFLKLPFSHELEAQGHIVGSEIIRQDGPNRIVRHEKVPFPSYPFEWPPEMLEAAGLLTIDLAERSLHHGYGLKDASPYNVLFRGAKPVFVDLLSFERRVCGDPLWLPYGQFVRNFLLPLAFANQLSIPLKGVFLSNRDGIEPEGVRQVIGPVRALLPPFLLLATIPALLSRLPNAKPAVRQHRGVPDDRAQFSLRQLYRSLQKQLERLAKTRTDRQSAWSQYEQNKPYTAEQADRKTMFVESALNRIKPKRVLDIGCNTGELSRLASRCGASVVAIDSDPAVVGRLWKKAHAENTDILPLVIDIARPSPAWGWRNLEFPSFLDRSGGYFDCIFMLGLVHHLQITERVPLDSIVHLAAELTNDAALLEFIPSDDPMVRILLRGRERDFMPTTQEAFERNCEPCFRIVEKTPLANSGRVLYLLRKKTPSSRP